MSRRKLLVKAMAVGVKVVNQEMRGDYGINMLAEREMEQLINKVDPDTYGMLIQQLLAFHADMQLEMAEDLVIFAQEQVAHTTGCPSVDHILDLCYTWIAFDLGIIRKKYQD